MLLGSSPDAPAHLTPTQVQAQFSLWAVMAAPLLIGSRLLSMPASDLETYTNPEVIRVSQDVLGVQGRPIWSSCPPYSPRDNWWMSPWSMPYDVCCMWTQALFTASAVAFAVAYCARGRTPQFSTLVAVLGLACALYVGVLWSYRPAVDECQQVWARPLSDGGQALCFINFASTPAAVACDARCLASIDLHVGQPVKLRDLVRRVDLDVHTLPERLEVKLDAEGGSALWLVEAKKFSV